MAYYKAGSWNVTCDVCGLRYKSDQIRKRWDGLMVCKEDYETRHPQTLIRAREEHTEAAFVRVEVDAFTFFCTLITKQPLADVGVADCATVLFAAPAIAGLAIATDSISGTTARQPIPTF